MRSNIRLDPNLVVGCRPEQVVPFVQPLKACQREPSIRCLQLCRLKLSPGKKVLSPVRVRRRTRLGKSTGIGDPEKNRCCGKNRSIAHRAKLHAPTEKTKSRLRTADSRTGLV